MTDQPFEPGGQAAPMQQVQVPTLNLELLNTNVNVVPHPHDRDQKLMVIGPLLVNLLLPLDRDGAREIQAALGNGLVIAQAADVPR